MDFRKWVPLPPIASAHGQEVDLLIYLVHLLMLLLFIGWGIYFVYVIYRFRAKKNPKANYHGIHSNPLDIHPLLIGCNEYRERGKWVEQCKQLHYNGDANYGPADGA